MSYLTDKYIGTSGCFTSPLLCAKRLNRPKGLSQCCLDTKLSDKFVKVTFTRLGGDISSNAERGAKAPTYLLTWNGSRRRASPFLSPLKEGVSWRHLMNYIAAETKKAGKLHGAVKLVHFERYYREKVEGSPYELFETMENGAGRHVLKKGFEPSNVNLVDVMEHLSDHVASCQCLDEPTEADICSDLLMRAFRNTEKLLKEELEK